MISSGASESSRATAAKNPGRSARRPAGIDSVCRQSGGPSSTFGTTTPSSASGPEERDLAGAELVLADDAGLPPLGVSTACCESREQIPEFTFQILPARVCPHDWSG